MPNKKTTNKRHPPEIVSLNRDALELNLDDISLEILERRLELAAAMWVCGTFVCNSFGGSCGQFGCGTFRSS